MLQAGEMSNSSSSNSLNLTSGSLGGKTLTMPRSRQSSVTSSQENLLDRKSTLTRKHSGIPTFSSPPKTADGKELSDFLIFLKILNVDWYSFSKISPFQDPSKKRINFFCYNIL